MKAFIKGAMGGGVAMLVGMGLHDIGAGTELSVGVALALFFVFGFGPFFQDLPD